MPSRRQLAKHGLPCRFVGILADAEHRQLVMPRAGNALVRAPEEHIHQICNAEALSGPVSRRKSLLRQYGAVHCFRRADAVVAIAAWLRLPLTEIREQCLTPAAR